MKQKFYISALIIFMVLTFSNLTAGGTIEDTSRTITVTGVGSVAAAPDIVRLNLGVQSMNKNLSEAIADNNRRIKSIIDVIDGYGISDSDYSTSNFSVYYQQPYTTDSSPDDGVYNVNNNIFIEIQEINGIGEFIQDALAAGANQFYGLEYAVSDTEPLMKEARLSAIKNAKALAEETAGMAGVSLGDIKSIEESQYYTGGMFADGIISARGSNSITTIPGEKKVETQVRMTFAFR